MIKRWGLQGDCVFYQFDESILTKDFKEVKTSILINGNNGNSHKVISGKFKIYSLKNKLVLRVLSDVVVGHDEHLNVVEKYLKPGIYLIGKPREKDHVKNIVRQVID
jgi:hypothetical protein